MVDETPLIAENTRGKKQGHRVLCCCDSRKATIMIALVSLFWSIVALVYAIIDTNVNGVWNYVGYSLSILFYILVVWGAIRFHRGAVVVCIIYEIVALVMITIGAVQYDWGTDEDKIAAISALILSYFLNLIIIYAQMTFVSEVSRGIMSPATHDREKYSCCCNV